MNQERFDDLTRALAINQVPRLQALKVLAASVFVSTFPLFRAGNVGAKSCMEAGQPCTRNNDCCRGICGGGLCRCMDLNEANRNCVTTHDCCDMRAICHGTQKKCCIQTGERCEVSEGNVCCSGYCTDGRCQQLQECPNGSDLECPRRQCCIDGRCIRLNPEAKVCSGDTTGGTTGDTTGGTTGTNGGGTTGETTGGTTGETTGTTGGETTGTTGETTGTTGETTGGTTGETTGTTGGETTGTTGETTGTTGETTGTTGETTGTTGETTGTTGETTGTTGETTGTTGETTGTTGTPERCPDGREFCGVASTCCYQCETCQGGTCVSTCVPPLSCCPDGCAHTDSDSINCGVCGNNCFVQCNFVIGTKCCDGMCVINATSCNDEYIVC
jgi:hypothetical protein